MLKIISVIPILLFISSVFIFCKPSVGKDGPVKVEEVSFEQQKKLFYASPEEKLKPTIWDTGDTTISNEDRLELFKPHVENIGGVYLGVGSSQNFTLAAWAKSKWIYLMDFTRIVVAVNKINISFLKAVNTGKEYATLWQKGSKKRALDIIKKEYENKVDATYLKFMLKAYRKVAWFQRKRLKVDLMLTKKRKYETWLTSDILFTRLQKLANEGRIRAVQGNLNGKITIKGISETVKKMGQKIRIAYFSNAEEYIAVCSPCNKVFMDNMLSMPVDDKSLIVRTVSSPNPKVYTWAPGSQLTTDRGFHYNIMKAQLFQRWMAVRDKKVSIHKILKGAKIDKANGFSEALLEPNS